MSRSYLFIPGNTPSMIQTMDVFNSDAVIFDLEDSVMPYEKQEARDLVVSFLSTYFFPDIKLYIRVNTIDSKLEQADIKKTKNLDISGYVIPKATIPLLKEAHSLAPNKKIIAILEEPMSILQAEKIAALPFVNGLLLGAEDLTRAMQVSRTNSGNEIDYARKHIVMVAHAYGIQAIDTPYTNTTDSSGLERDAVYAKSIGFHAKAIIHPNHVDTINNVFSPSTIEIRQAKRILEKAKNTKKGAFSLDGKMIDAPIIKKAEDIVKKAKQYHLG